jgi:hypothetical protein
MDSSYVRSRVRTRTHGSVGRRELRLPLTRSLAARTRWSITVGCNCLLGDTGTSPEAHFENEGNKRWNLGRDAAV